MIDRTRSGDDFNNGQKNAAHRLPQLRLIDAADVKAALWQGIDDFKEMRTYVLYIGIVYALVGFVLVRVIFSYQFVELVFPLLAGFALIGPFVSVGLMELSRRREAGLETHWGHMFSAWKTASSGTILVLGVMLLIIFVAWVGVARELYAVTFGDRQLPLGLFASELFTTAHGWLLIILGNGIGALFALLVLTISVLAFPLALDRRVTPATAILTSVQAARMNPKPVLTWGLIVGTALLAGSLPLFIGTALALPILGHANWHLYTKMVER